MKFAARIFQSAGRLNPKGPVGFIERPISAFEFDLGMARRRTPLGFSLAYQRVTGCPWAVPTFYPQSPAPAITLVEVVPQG